LNCWRFQCSSASRKFLNLIGSHLPEPDWHVSVLFSEPKIPQCCIIAASANKRLAFQCSSASRKFLNCFRRRKTTRCGCVSVLFSEPKIPQYVRARTGARSKRGFSALQRAENSSIALDPGDAEPYVASFSALQRAENSSMFNPSVQRA